MTFAIGASRFAAMAAAAFMAFAPVQALAGDDDLNPVFAGLEALSSEQLDRSNGRGHPSGGGSEEAESALQNAVVTVVGDGVINGGYCGGCSNDLGSSFSGASGMTAITQNNGSNNALNNLVMVEVNMHQ